MIDLDKAIEELIEDIVPGQSYEDDQKMLKNLKALHKIDKEGFQKKLERINTVRRSEGMEELTKEEIFSKDFSAQTKEGKRRESKASSIKQKREKQLEKDDNLVITSKEGLPKDKSYFKDKYNSNGKISASIEFYYDGKRYKLHINGLAKAKQKRNSEGNKITVYYPSVSADDIKIIPDFPSKYRIDFAKDAWTIKDVKADLADDMIFIKFPKIGKQIAIKKKFRDAKVKKL